MMNHTLIVRNERSDNREYGRPEYLKAYCVFPLLLCFLFFAFGDCATAKAAGDVSPVPKEISVITAIDIQDNTLTVKVDKPFIYTIYKPGDPYKMIIDLPDVSIGAFNKKVVSRKAGITEVVPLQIDTPSRMARLEILLQTPSSVEQDYRNNVLTIRVKEDNPRKEDQPKDPRAAALPGGEKEASHKETNPNPDTKVRAVIPKATEITDISFDASADAVKIFIKGNGALIPNVFPLDERIVIDIADVVLNTPVPSGVVSPVKGLRAGKHDGKIRLVIDLKEKTMFDVAAIGDSIVVTLKKTGKELLATAPTQMPDEGESSPMESLKEEKAYEAAAGSRCDSYMDGRENVNLDFQDQDIVPVLRLFSDISGCNLFIHPDVKGRATMKFRDVPWNQAFDTILKTFSLGKSVEGNIIRVAPHTVFAKESEEKAKAKEALIKAEPLETKIYPISYAKIKDVDTSVKNSKILTSRGSISTDERTSSMLIQDVASVFPKVEDLLATLDKPTPQVMIEARIVEINTEDTTSLGISWGLQLNASNALMSLGGFPTLGTGAFTGNNFLVDLPSGASAAGSGSGFNFGLLNPSKTLGLDVQLDALEKIGKGKIISTPRIVTVDNVKASIMQGTSEPFPKLTTEGTISTEYKDVVLSTDVTPHITPNGSVSMLVRVKKEDVLGTVNIGGSQVPRTSKIEGDTQVLVQNGETLVIGGIYKKTERNDTSGVPGLMKIPILGWLFKNRVTAETTTELMIFITPRIVENPKEQ
jgi:type IV pilus assembly protein PilQ